MTRKTIHIHGTTIKRVVRHQVPLGECARGRVWEGRVRVDLGIYRVFGYGQGWTAPEEWSVQRPTEVPVPNTWVENFDKQESKITMIGGNDGY